MPCNGGTQVAVPDPFDSGRKKLDGSNKPATIQTWQKAGECPEGTVPMMRSDKENHDSYALGRMKRFPPMGVNDTYAIDEVVRRDAGHQYAVVKTQKGAYYGGGAAFNIWQPNVEQRYEYSLAQMWLVSEEDGGLTNTMEVGWHVFPTLHNEDKNPRIFIYWTSDDYSKTGCYNLECVGFVLVGRKVVIGGAISPSIRDSAQTSLSLSIQKSASTGNWWLHVADEIVGYWPSSIFTGALHDHAELIQWGGEIIDFGRGGRHTATEMGSGHFPFEGVNRAAYVELVQVVDKPGGALVDAGTLTSRITNSKCYDLKINEYGKLYIGE
uniref:Neprosin PEP catalytic domain-containing protein n=1 Tax=Kalanchoe fedtschenkoi TaxID=63787 RepID=A0A7N0VM62_KALFE